MQFIPQILFLIITGIAIYLFYKKASEIRRNILLGKEEDFSDNKNKRWNNMILLALGQKKMFRNPIVALLHFIVYAGFIIINIEVLEIVLDGILGKHRLFAGLLPMGLYQFLINSFEILALLVLTACVVFLIRRNIIKVKRFTGNDLKGWAYNDANYILFTEIVLMSMFLIMNASDTLLQERNFATYAQHSTGNFIISSYIQPLINSFSDNSLVLIERVCWWLHIIGIFAFLNYLPYSKHLHVLLAFPNAYYARLEPKGKMKNMPSVQNEVLYAMQPELAPTNAAPPERFGAKDVFDLSWRNL
ncbi:MAG TPA: Fe-S oxidoreductase, partial [Chitinophagaceae bacterium]|nr:Fe-S oxidoreductase [Chitinophagaceae bacterium]